MKDKSMPGDKKNISRNAPRHKHLHPTHPASSSKKIALFLLLIYQSSTLQSNFAPRKLVEQVYSGQL